jgi:hypothetical protein
MVGRRHDDGVRIRSLERLDDDPGVVDRHRDRLEAVQLGCLVRVALAGLLDPDPPASRRGKHLGHQAKALGEPVGDDDPVGAGGRSAHAVEVGRQALAELDCAAEVEVAQAVAGQFV